MEKTSWHMARIRYGMGVIAVNAVLSLCAYAVARLFVPQEAVLSGWGIPLFFCIFGLVQFLILEKSAGAGWPYTSVYLSLKVFKLLFSLLLLVFYRFWGKVDFVACGLALIVFYLVNLIWDTLFFVRFEKICKK